MMSGIQIEIVGLDQIQQALAPEVFNKSVHRALDLSAQTWRDDTKRLPAVSSRKNGWDAIGIPVDTGSMAQRVQVETVEETGATVKAKTNYSKAVHDGVSPHQRSKRTFVPGVGWKTTTFHHSGMPARPFFDYALQQGTLAKIEKIFQDQFEAPFLKAVRVQ